MTQPKIEATVYDIIKEEYLKAVIFAIATYTPFSAVDLWDAYQILKSIDKLIITIEICRRENLPLFFVAAEMLAN
jgi:hypothetical protein